MENTEPKSLLPEMPGSLLRVRDQFDSARGYDVVVGRPFDPMARPSVRRQYEEGLDETPGDEVHTISLSGTKRPAEDEPPHVVPHNLARSEEAEHDREHVSRYELSEDEDDTTHPRRRKRALLEALHEWQAEEGGGENRSPDSKSPEAEVRTPEEPSAEPHLASHWAGHPELPGFYPVDPALGDRDHRSEKSRAEAPPPRNPKRKPEPKHREPTTPRQFERSWKGARPHYDPRKTPAEHEFAPGARTPGDVAPQALREGVEDTSVATSEPVAAAAASEKPTAFTAAL